MCKYFVLTGHFFPNFKNNPFSWQPGSLPAECFCFRQSAVLLGCKSRKSSGLTGYFVFFSRASAGSPWVVNA